MNRRHLVRWLGLALLLVLVAGIWLLPIGGQLILVQGNGPAALLWPQLRMEPPAPRPGQTVTLWATDGVPWAHVLLTVNGSALGPKDFIRTGDTWTWQWSFVAPDSVATTLVMYRDCQTGCLERGRMMLGSGETAVAPLRAPTKLGVVFANPQRDWHGRSGWDVELTYARLADQSFWGIDDLALRAQQAAGQGQKVLVRVDYAQGQSLPPAGDSLALNEFLQYAQRLARDARLQSVYGYFIGSGFNALDSNALAKDRPVTAHWYARVFNGAGVAVSQADNIVQTMRAENPRARLLVGPVRPWSQDQSGDQRYAIDVPWLDYMNTLAALVDAGARVKQAAGIPLAAPDGFAVNAPARLAAPTLAGRSAAGEPRLDLRRADWGSAQAGFRVYRDWQNIINAYETLRGLPLYINATNTFASDDGVAPAQNYPPGWLTTALDVVNQEQQVQALCWFIDFDRSGDTRWDSFSLSKRIDRMAQAADELDALLKR